MLMIGHRGVAGLEPENTLRSIRRAFELGLSMVEIDVHVLDGMLVVIHDEEVGRTSNGVGNISDLGFEAVRLLDAGKGERVPTLEEVIRVVPKGRSLNIEIKGKEVAGILAEFVKQHPYVDYLVSSFDWDQLRAFRALDPTTKIAVLTEGADPWACADELNAAAVNPSVETLKVDFVTKAHIKEMKVYSYTVRTMEQWLKAKDCGVDGIFVDNPIDFISS